MRESARRHAAILREMFSAIGLALSGFTRGNVFCCILALTSAAASSVARADPYIYIDDASNNFA